MRHQKTALERALPIVAAAYGEQFGVRVVLSGSDACTNGQTIVLPMLDSLSELKDVLFGYLAHESAHIRDSDFTTLSRCRSAIEHNLTNLIEDIRIEGLIQDAFPGTRFTLTAMEEYIHAQGWTPVPSSEENEASQLFRYLYHRLYGEYLSREVYQPLITASRQVVEQTFPTGFFVRLDGLLGKYMTNLQCSDDCLKVARAILKALKDAEDEKQQQQTDSGEAPQQDKPSQGESSGGSGSQDADANESTSENQGAGESDSPEDPATAPSSCTDQANPSVSSDPGDNSTDGTMDQSSNGASTHDRILQETDLPEDTANQLRDALSSQARKDQSGQHFQIDSAVGELGGNDRGDNGQLQAGILTSSAIRSRLIGLLQAQTRQSQRLHIRGRRVDGRRLSRLASGDARVFIQRDETSRPETSVHVLLDCSGSMQHQQEIANQATVSLALAISTIPKCDIAVSMFPGNGGSVSPMIRRGQPVRPNLGRFCVDSGGGTPLAEAMLYAARELTASHKARQVMIVITDGDPNNPQAVNYLNGLIKGHIDTYAIGIGSPAVKRFFENWCVISDVSQLQSALFSIASNVLELDM